jgi:hypothetical protein
MSFAVGLAAGTALRWALLLVAWRHAHWSVAALLALGQVRVFAADVEALRTRLFR